MKVFNSIGDFITSKYLVLFALVALILGLTPHVAAFYFEALPHGQGAFTSSYFLAGATQVTLLLITVNYKLLSHAMKWSNVKLIVLITFVILLFYLKVFTETNSILVFQKVFVALIISGLEMIYTELFHIKWTFSTDRVATPRKQAVNKPAISRVETTPANNGNRKLPEEVVTKIIQLGKETGMSNRKIAEEVNTSHVTVSKILKQQTQ